MDQVKAYALVSIQFICFLLIFASGSPFACRPPLLILEIAGMALGVWALLVMGLHNLNVSPLVKEGALLVTRGPYRSIRHPMYASVLLAAWPLIIDRFSLPLLTAGLVLTLDLILKIRYEESLLRKHFPAYEAYMQTTKRLIPFLY